MNIGFRAHVIGELNPLKIRANTLTIGPEGVAMSVAAPV
jgi:hypothetical protein